MEDEIELVVASFHRYWGDSFETPSGNESHVVARLLWLHALTMKEIGTAEGAKDFLKAWDYAWGNKGFGNWHPKWWDEPISRLRSKVRVYEAQRA